MILIIIWTWLWQNKFGGCKIVANSTIYYIFFLYMYTGFEKRDEYLDNLQKWRKNQPKRLWMSENGNAIECKVIPFEQALHQHRMIVADIR